MPILRRPKHYSLLVALLLTSPAIFLLNIWVMQKGVIAKVIQPEKLWWLGIEAAWAILTARWLYKLYWRGFVSFVLLAATVLGMNMFFLITTRNYALAFYALFVLILAALYALNLYKNLRESYYHSGQRWYEGSPRFLPRIRAELKAGEQLIPARLSRLGVEGCFAYPETAGVDKIEGVVLKLGELSLECAVELIARSKDGLGHGLRFVARSSDQSKDIKDFIDRVRSSGYVA